MLIKNNKVIWERLSEEEKLLCENLKTLTSRQDLCLIMNMTDSYLRTKIRELRKKGVPVYSPCNKKGYFISNKKEHKMQLIEGYKSRIFDMWETVKAISETDTEIEVLDLKVISNER